MNCQSVLNKVMGLYIVNTNGSMLSLKTIEKGMIATVAEVYNSSPDSVYATGISLPVTNKTIIYKYLEAASSSNEIFTAVCVNNPYKVAGVIRAGLRPENECTLWINSIVILPCYRRKGYGSTALRQLTGRILKDRDISRAYVSVLEENTAGKQFWLYNGFTHIRTVYKRYGSLPEELKVEIMGRHFR